VTRNNDPILVVGAGLGGACISLALTRKGFRVRPLEQAPAQEGVAA
jgi:2-polyprenyl-6-methoxyphenol hydroxylase-like FAD-dependent oxidoreductase